jgi:SNF2 family DNA or RNA helicase
VGASETVVRATYLREEARVKLSVDNASSEWMAIWSACHEISDDVRDGSLVDISIPVWVLFGLGSTFRYHASTGRLSFKPDAETAAILRNGLANRHEVEEEAPAEMAASELRMRLGEAGFVRELTTAQARNVARLIRFSAGADFSVPGAGKTTDALAFFALKRKPEDRLVVISPLNAFAPWEEQIELCFGVANLRVTRLVGSVQLVEERLVARPDIVLINYHKFSQPAIHRFVLEYIARQRTFVFLDESHKIKRGEDGAWGNAVLSIAHLPAYKLVLSGTPLPNSEADLVAQMRFLHYEEDIDDQNVTRLIQPIFVRTTKDELGLPEVTRRSVKIPLGPGQRQLYEVLSTSLARELRSALSRKERLSVRQLGKSVLRLLKFVSNPALLIPELERSEAATLRDVLLDEDSRKIEYAVTRARNLATQSRKCIIWSSFVDNVEVIAGRLADLGAEYIHGGVTVGSEEDDTRERRIKQFHEDPHRFVLVANPAAAGEAISLHTVCHNAIYIDRTYNAAQFLQSEDRIHRVGLPRDTVTEVEILVAPGTIDDSVNRRLIQKVEVMGRVLNDPGLRIDPNYEDPEDDEEVGDADLRDFLQDVDVERAS